MTDKIKLLPISETEFNEWMKSSIQTYISENIKNGLTKEDAEKKAEIDYKQLLPDGLDTENQYIYSIKDTNENLAGTLWFGIRGPKNNKKAFIYDIIVNESERGKGYGESALKLLDDEVRKLGFNHIGLHVFGHNAIARKLYEKMGYEITNLYLEKKL